VILDPIHIQAQKKDMDILSLSNCLPALSQFLNNKKPDLVALQHTSPRLPAKAHQQLSDERLIGVVYLKHFKLFLNIFILRDKQDGGKIKPYHSNHGYDMILYQLYYIISSKVCICHLYPNVTHPFGIWTGPCPDQSRHVETCSF
jgi:hypothetical protein